MGLSVERVGAVGSTPYVSTVQNSYAIDNRSAISDAFVESLGRSSATDDVQAAPPVQYANAKNIKISGTQKVEDSLKVNKAYNDLAEAFNGVSTSYGADSMATSYSPIGGSFDAYA